MSKTYFPSSKSNSCPVCDDTTGKCRTVVDSEIVLCMRTLDQFSAPTGWKFLGTTTGGYFAGKLAPIDGSTPQKTTLERRVEQDERAIKRAIERADLPSLTDRHNRLSAKSHTLTTAQNTDLLRRGLTQVEIDWCLSQGYLWAERNGYGIGAIDPVTELIVGGQIARDDRSPKYIWLLPGQTHLPETGQNPLSVWKSPDFDPTKPADIRFCEGFLHSLISALKSWRSDMQVVYIGAAGATFQDQTLARVLGALPDGTMTLYPDAGAVSNRGVMTSYQSLNKLICPTVESPQRLKVAWWGQLDKTHPDCDELDGTESIEILPFWQFQQKTRALVTTVVTQQYLEPIALPSSPGNLFVSSPTGTGKTEIVEDLISQFFTRYPDGLADLIGYRNGLLLQTVSRIASKGRVNTVHKFNMDLSSGGWNGANSLAYCLNSLDQRLDALHKAIDSGRKIFLVLDEVGFIVSHWLELMKSQPQTGLNFARLLRRIGEGHGFIAGLQANLRDTPIALIQELTRESFPLSIVRNEYQGEGWKTQIISTLSKKEQATNHDAGLNAAQTALEGVSQGSFTLITTSSQEWLERLDAAFHSQGFKLLRVDALTVAESSARATIAHQLIQQLFKEPREAIERAKTLGYHAIGITPTAETGVSIDGVNFDQIIEYAPVGTSEAALQRLARDRNNSTPRSIFATNRAADYRADVGSSAESILKKWALNSKQGFNAAQVLEVLNSEEQETYATEQDELLSILVRHAARSVVEGNNDRRELNLNIERRLLEDGHSVERLITEISSEFRDLWKIAKATIADRNCNLFAKSPVIPIDNAREVIRAGNATRERLYSAQKTIKLENYPGLDLDKLDLVQRLIFDNRGAVLSAITQTWMLKNPAVAQQIDRACWKGQIGRGIVWAPSLKREALKSQTLADTGILEILELEEYSETTPGVIELRSYCIQNHTQLRRICGYAAAFDESHSGIEMVSWVLRRLNYKQAVTRKFGARGEQVRFWRAIDLNEGDRTLVEAALHQKWDSLEPAHSNDSTIGSHDFSVINHIRKMMPTGLNLPPLPPENRIHPATYGLQIVSESDDSVTYEYIPTPEERLEWGLAS